METKLAVDSHEFQRLAEWSACRYLEYLQAANKGIYINPVLQIIPTGTPNLYEFHLEDRVKQNTIYVIFYHGKPIKGLVIVKAIGPRGRARAVQVSDEKGLLGQMPRIYPADFQLVSDLKFLIENLRYFYSKHLISFAPSSPNVDTELPAALTEPMSEEQRQAYDMVFSSPFCYIHGAPGTGKTNMVLSRCILRYILSGKRVFLLAPTNNALEQMLRGILPTFKSLDIDLHTVYRLGMSSHEFAQEFPEVVGDPNMDNLLADLKEQESSIMSKLRDMKLLSRVHHFQSESKRKAAEQYRAVGNQIQQLLPEIKKFSENQATQEANAASISGAIASNKRQTALLQQQIDRLQQTYVLEYGRFSELERSCNSFLSIFRSRKKRHAMSATLQELGEQIKVHMDELSDLRAKQKDLSDFHAALQTQLATAEKNIKKSAEEIRTYTERLYQLSDPLTSLRLIVRNIIANGSYDTTAISEAIAEKEQDYRTYLSSQNLPDPAPLEAELSSVQNQLNNLGNTARQIQHKSALVLAGTVDSSLRELDDPDLMQSDLPVSHIFLDEAGYTSIARGAAAFSLGVPVTFLGDHHQLPPILEKPKVSSDESPLCLWALSAAYLPDLLNYGVDYLYQNCLADKATFSEPSFIDTPTASLNKSYRFGQSLADILGQHIYGPGFGGVSIHPFEIQVINAPFTMASKTRTSCSETETICHYVRGLEKDSFAILSPYNNQVNEIRQKLPKDMRDSILSVHRSQGREWDTVILSVVDTSNPYFTDSTLPIGKSVLCTAISRAKKRLVLVCDTTAWKYKNNQIISSLIQCASQIDASPDLPFII